MQQMAAQFKNLWERVMFTIVLDHLIGSQHCTLFGNRRFLAFILKVECIPVFYVS